LKDSVDRRIAKPTVQGDEDVAHPLVQVTALCFIPKAWAVHFLDQISPCEAYQHYKELQVTIPVMDQPQLYYMEACWLKAACLQVSMLLTSESVICQW
jgi:hypothetical protein